MIGAKPIGSAPISARGGGGGAPPPPTATPKGVFGMPLNRPLRGSL